MEEAYILCDRVDMLINDTFKWCGGQLYLKITFGEDYYLALRQEHNIAFKQHTYKMITFICGSIINYPMVLDDLQS